MLTTIDQTIQLRGYLLSLVKPLSDEALLYTPAMAHNNILWNLAHLVVTQQILHYKLSSQEMLVPKEMVEAHKKGTSPQDWTTTPDRNEIETLFLTLPQKLKDDYQQGIFHSYSPYQTSTGIELTSIEDAISFNLFHEGIHLGAILALKRAFKAD